MARIRHHMTMNTIDHTQVPKTFSLCIHDTYPLAEQCLRLMAWTDVR